MKLGRLTRPPRATAPTIVGHIDTIRGNRLFGWAADLENPLKHVTIDVFADQKLIGSTVGDQFRKDLLQIGAGHGRHGFFYDLPLVTSPTDMEISVRVHGTGTFLRSGEAEKLHVQLEPLPPITYIAVDVVNNCNLRCPFCLVDYSQVDHTELMSAETFQKIVTLTGLIGDEGLWLSCLHEPTMHPKLNDFIGMIPVNARQKTWFTTNLTRPLSEEYFELWAQSGLHHINVSLDSMNPELFAVLRKFGRFEVFRKNLDLMTDVFRRHANPPKLRFITMAFKSNIDEIPSIVQHSHERWLSSENEVRYTLNFGHIADEFRKEHYLERPDWQLLTEKLSKLPYNYTIVYPPEGYEDFVQATFNYDALKSRDTQAAFLRERPLRLRARPNGTLLVVGHEGEAAIDIASLDDPAAYFRTLLSA